MSILLSHVIILLLLLLCVVLLAGSERTIGLLHVEVVSIIRGSLEFIYCVCVRVCLSIVACKLQPCLNLHFCVFLRFRKKQHLHFNSQKHWGMCFSRNRENTCNSKKKVIIEFGCVVAAG